MRIKEIGILLTFMTAFILVLGLAVAENVTNNNSSASNESGTNLTDINTTDGTNATTNITDTNVTVDNSTDEEVNDMYNIHGAKMRLLQLEYQIRWKVARAEVVVSVIQEKGGNVSELQAILSELNGLADDAKQARDAITPGDVTNETVKKFIEIKSDAQALLKEFREKAKLQLSAGDRAKIAEKWRAIKKDVLEQLKGQIKKERCELNAEHAEFILQKLNVSDDDLINKTKNCNATKADITEKLKDNLKNLNREKKTFLRTKLEEKKREVSEWSQTRVENALRKANSLEETAKRLEERAARLREQAAAGSDIGDALTKRANKIAEKIRNRRNSD
jgi:hypothetical protein